MKILYQMCKRKFGEKMRIGRDQCYALFRSNGLVFRKRNRPKTTNSNHNYFIYPDLLNNEHKYEYKRMGMMMVSDITYVATSTGWAYLSLITDMATRLIVGFALHPTLDKQGTIKALERALDCYTAYGIDLKQLVHHSDRGSQYCSNEYIEILKQHDIKISMTQTGDPLHNALAERMNWTIKGGWLFDCENLGYEDVERKVSHAIQVYNELRPHSALGMITPKQAAQNENFVSSPPPRRNGFATGCSQKTMPTTCPFDKNSLTLPTDRTKTVNQNRT